MVLPSLFKLQNLECGLLIQLPVSAAYLLVFTVFIFDMSCGDLSSCQLLICNHS